MSESQNEDDVPISESLRTLFESISFNAFGKIFTKLLGFITTIILTRHLGADQYGVYAYALSVISFLALFAHFGVKRSIMKFLPKYSKSKDNQSSAFAYGIATVTVWNVVVATALVVFAPQINEYTLSDPNLPVLLRIFTMFLVANSALKIITSSFQAFEKVRLSISINQVLKPILRFLAIIIAILLGGKLVGISVAIVTSILVVVVVSVYLFFRTMDIRPRLAQTESIAREYFSFSSVIVFRAIGMTLYTKTDFILLGFFLTSTAVGVYKVSWVLGTIIDLPLVGVGIVFPAMVSRYYENDQKKELEKVFGVATRWTFSAAILMFTVTIIYRKEFLSLFGSEFRSGHLVLFIMAASHLVSNFVGPQGTILLMTDRHRLNTIQIWIFGLVNLGLNVVLIPIYGLVGAAIAMFVGYVSLDLVQALEVWYFEGIHPFSRSFLKPVGAAICTALTALLVRFLLSGILLIIVGGALGTLTFFAVLYMMGLEKVDKEILSNYNRS